MCSSDLVTIDLRDPKSTSSKLSMMCVSLPPNLRQPPGGVHRAAIQSGFSTEVPSSCSLDPDLSSLRLKRSDNLPPAAAACGQVRLAAQGPPRPRAITQTLMHRHVAQVICNTACAASPCVPVALPSTVANVRRGRYVSLIRAIHNVNIAFEKPCPA